MADEVGKGVEVAPTCSSALVPDIAVHSHTVLRNNMSCLSDYSTKAWTLLLAIAPKKPFSTKAFLTHLCLPSEITTGATHCGSPRQ